MRGGGRLAPRGRTHAPMLLSSLTTSALLASSAAATPDGPCDIFAKGTPPTPCVAAHSMTRALFASYTGPLYAVKNAAGAVKDIPTNKGGVADAAVQDAFCGAPNSCVVQAIYDQSPMENHLGIEHGAPNLGPPRNRQDTGVNFTDPKSKTTLGGAPVYSAFFVGDNSQSHSYTGQGYSNRTAKGTAVGDEPQTSYAVFSGRHYNSGCCELHTPPGQFALPPLHLPPPPLPPPHALPSSQLSVCACALLQASTTATRRT